jgi:hypothetical protein
MNIKLNLKPLPTVLWVFLLHFLSCFTSGLKLEIRREVQAFQPISLSQAISLAKLQEDKLADIHTITKSRFSSSFSRSNNSSSQPLSVPSLPSPSTQPASSQSTKSNPNFKRLSPAELQARREKGLCYN